MSYWPQNLPHLLKTNSTLFLHPIYLLQHPPSQGIHPLFLSSSANHLQPFFDTSCLRILPHLDKTFGILSSRSIRRHQYDLAGVALNPNQLSRHTHINYPWIITASPDITGTAWSSPRSSGFALQAPIPLSSQHSPPADMSRHHVPQSRNHPGTIQVPSRHWAIFVPGTIRAV